MNKNKSIFKSQALGILFATSAIGVSYLVHSNDIPIKKTFKMSYKTFNIMNFIFNIFLYNFCYLSLRLRNDFMLIIV